MPTSKPASYPPKGATRRRPDLPPPGDARREELARRADALAAKAETTAAARGIESIDPSKLEPDRDILAHISSLRVKNALPEYAYCWANFSADHGLQVTRKQADGWEVVCGDMPEALERRDELGRRRLGDVILMRVPLDQKLRLDRRERLKKQLQQEGVNAAIMELAEKHRDSGITVREITDPAELRRASNPAARQLAKQIAGQKFNEMIQTGQVPGMSPGTR